MAEYIKTLKEDNGDITYPVTQAGAVLLTGGGDLETTLNAKATQTSVDGKISIGDVQGSDLTANAKTTILNMIYPVGSIFMSATITTAAAVGTALGGTWVAWGAGRVPVGVDTSQTEFNTVEKTGGEKTHTLTENEMPAHTHTFGVGSQGRAQSQTSGSSGYAWNAGSRDTSSAGGGAAHNNLQPYITCYMYKRTA